MSVTFVMLLGMAVSSAFLAVSELAPGRSGWTGAVLAVGLMFISLYLLIAVWP